MFITYMERTYTGEAERMREWKKLAKAVSVPIVENPRLVTERHKRAMAVVQQELGGGDDMAG